MKSIYAEDYIEYHEIIECIASALDAKDPYTANHSLRVSDMAERVCERVGITGREKEEIHIAAHLHDIGKIGIPDAVLNKRDELNVEDWEIVKQHPRIGAEILSKSPRLYNISQSVLYHHEKYDGSGYPVGIQGKEIPLGARIISICDSMDTMLSDRVYRAAYEPARCYEEIKENLGTMYDPQIGEIVLRHFEEVIGK